MSKNNKRIIFHLPDFVDFKNPKSGSQVRPCRLIDSFTKLGYDVEIVSGYGKERKSKMIEIKKNIESGIIYDFVYSESSTTPTALTEKSHLPIYPFLDFRFLLFCKKKGIKIGLFYRDVYWNFTFFKKSFNVIVFNYLKLFYLYDLFMYNKVVDCLFLPSILMRKYIPYDLKMEIKSLPPGIVYSNDRIKILESIENNKFNNELNLIYVGDIGELYRIDKLFCIKNKNIKIRICCRKEDWEENKIYYLNKLTSNIEILHVSGDELSKLYLISDIACLFIEPSEYRSFSMPVKFFEYLSFQLPIISVSGNAVSDFIEKNNIGWVINYDECELETLLDRILVNREILVENKMNIVKNVLNENTWDARVYDIINTLK